MSDEIIRKEVALQAGTETATSIQMTNQGKGPMIGVANNPSFINYGITQEMFNEYMNTFFQQLAATKQIPEPAVQEPSQEVSHAIEWSSLRSDCFNLFVLENEKYNCGAFAISKTRVLNRYMREDYKSQYRILDPAAISEIMEMPCIFTMRNKFFRRAGDNQPAALGKLTSIIRQLDNIRFSYEIFQPVPQKFINDNIPEFNLVRSTLRNELDEEHWSIKAGNLQEIIARLGIIIK